MDELFTSGAGRTCVALGMTLMIGIALYRGRTGGRFDVSQEEAPVGFGCLILLWVFLAGCLWISVLI